MKEQEFLQEVKEIELLNSALGLLEWDSQTGMPEAGSGFRGETVGYLSGMSFERSVGPKIQEALSYFDEHPDELSEVGLAVYKQVKEDYELNHSIPPERMQAYNTALTNAHAAWLKARKMKDFGQMKAEIQTIIDFLKEFIPYWKKEEATNYDVLLNQYEPELTVAKLDQIFAQVKTGIMEIRAVIAEKGTAPRTDFLSRKVTKEQQRKFVIGVAEQLGYDFSRGRLDDTVHPFMLDLNRNDARITTRWDETNFSMATFGVIHEAGHGIYEQSIDPKYDYTPLSTGASMGIHESQSLFNEIIIGSNKQFWEKQFPFFKECTEGTFDDITFADFYDSLKETKASLIRIEADSLTYPLHIIIRYEIEKLIFNEDISVDELPKIWNDKYEEYLGIRPENDLEGIVQDVHWSGGSFGYFPSYALGYMYAAQLRHAMENDVEINEVLASDDYSPIKNWLTEHIHQYGASRKPNRLIKDATGEELNPQYLIDYMKSVYYDVYKINE
ncbi:carboxypeptidase M32 [Enterococcus sp. DIV0242_7C1]|uniref:Metal-dependent carboxypeptidase n=1 Tax=Candidatus Enterococcus dunnyi TaxID=1834192 RepID=A0A200JF12_9ENTE|nr:MULTISPECIES: carboxypeptidase M32 [unclassified Enterococcus]MBO0468958.1 carboxypeptidase M32 [Enterococcus sp. DIV0242_7C1]OUZ35752.1 thermostable carboxypeptidase 1 [Enterococcus sp. 9D6_DIV0238]